MCSMMWLLARCSLQSCHTGICLITLKYGTDIIVTLRLPCGNMTPAFKGVTRYAS